MGSTTTSAATEVRDAFVDVWTADDDWVSAEFAALVRAGWPPLPTGRGSAWPTDRTGGVTAVGTTAWPFREQAPPRHRQRSPPRHRLLVEFEGR